MERLADISKFESLTNSFVPVQNRMGKLKRTVLPLVAGALIRTPAAVTMLKKKVLPLVAAGALVGGYGAFWQKTGEMIDAHDKEYRAAIESIEDVQDIEGLAHVIYNIDWNNLSTNDRVYLKEILAQKLLKMAK